jgi:hypothetical protein
MHCIPFQKSNCEKRSTSPLRLLDEVVQPQSGTNVSAYLRDDRGVGVTNFELQSTCAGHPAGGFLYGHAEVLASPLTYALVVDALNHDGPADLSRLDLQTVCANYAAPGLSLADVVATVGLTPMVGFVMLSSPVKQTAEPDLIPYTNA